MATRYDEIIKLRAGKAAYNIAEEKEGEWESFIPNKQFDYVLKTVLKSVRGNDIDNHKSFWVNGTYGTGKSHAVAVLSHLLGDPVENFRSGSIMSINQMMLLDRQSILSEIRNVCLR